MQHFELESHHDDGDGFNKSTVEFEQQMQKLGDVTLRADLTMADA